MRIHELLVFMFSFTVSLKNMLDEHSIYQGKRYEEQ